MSGKYNHLFAPHKTEEEKFAEVKRAKSDRISFMANASRAMPPDIEESSRRWGMENFMRLLWVSAFETGYQQAVQDAALSSANNGGDTDGR